MSVASIIKNLGKGFYSVVIDYDSAELRVLIKQLQHEIFLLREEWVITLNKVLKLSEEINVLHNTVVQNLNNMTVVFKHSEEATFTIMQGAPLSFLKVSQVLDGERNRWANIEEKLNEIDTWAETQLDHYLAALTTLIEKSKEREKLRQELDYNEYERYALGRKIRLLEEIIATKERTVNCIDYTVSLKNAEDKGYIPIPSWGTGGGSVDASLIMPDTVGITDILGETDQQFIYPGSLINDDYRFGLSTDSNHQLALWDGQRDGNMRKILAFMFPPAAWFDAALFPGWQRWFPYYRVGKIIDFVVPIGETLPGGTFIPWIDEAGLPVEEVTIPTKLVYALVKVLSNSSNKHTCDISLPVEKVECMVDGQPVEDFFYKVPTEYMQTGIMNFNKDDIIILDFVRRPPQIYNIGFGLAPKPNFFPFVIERGDFNGSMGHIAGYKALTDEDVVEGNPIPFEIIMYNYPTDFGCNNLPMVPFDQQALEQKAWYNKDFEYVDSENNPQKGLWEIYITESIRNYDYRGVLFYLSYYGYDAWTQVINTETFNRRFGESTPYIEDWSKKEDRIKPGVIKRIRLPEPFRFKLERADGLKINDDTFIMFSFSKSLFPSGCFIRGRTTGTVAEIVNVLDIDFGTVENNDLHGVVRVKDIVGHFESEYLDLLSGGGSVIETNVAHVADTWTFGVNSMSIYLAKPYGDTYPYVVNPNLDYEAAMHPQFEGYNVIYDRTEQMWRLVVPSCKATRRGVFMQIKGVNRSLRMQYPHNLSYLSLWQTEDLITEDSAYLQAPVITMPYYHYYRDMSTVGGTIPGWATPEYVFEKDFCPGPIGQAIEPDSPLWRYYIMTWATRIRTIYCSEPHTVTYFVYRPPATYSGFGGSFPCYAGIVPGCEHADPANPVVNWCFDVGNFDVDGIGPGGPLFAHDGSVLEANIQWKGAAKVPVSDTITNYGGVLGYVNIPGCGTALGGVEYGSMLKPTGPESSPLYKCVCNVTPGNEPGCCNCGIGAVDIVIDMHFSPRLFTHIQFLGTGCTQAISFDEFPLNVYWSDGSTKVFPFRAWTLSRDNLFVYDGGYSKNASHTWYV